MTAIADVVVQVIETTVEDQVVSSVAESAVKRRRPVATVATSVVEIRTEAVARSREEDAVAVLFAGDFVTFYTVLGCPTPSTVIE